MPLQTFLNRKPGVPQMLFKATLLASAVSLLGYIPYKYATQLHALQGLYAFLFPLSALVAVAGIAAALDPNRLLRLPLIVRAGLVSIATLWIVTGLLCVPTLVERTWMSPAAGLFATFHMVVQHLFVSASVVTLVLAPHLHRGWFGEKFLFTLKRSV
ncbi:MAG TPA: hypothetical protein VLD83_11515 [Candidatus Binatia bacterium]|nr:hypothetical protein [Candidatus Binatia bacterium]